MEAPDEELMIWYMSSVVQQTTTNKVVVLDGGQCLFIQQ